MMNNKMKEQRRFFVYWFIFIFAVMALVPSVGMKVEAATTCDTVLCYPGMTNSPVNFREQAGTTFPTYGMLKKEQPVQILGWITNSSGTWYKCNANIGGSLKTGYISAGYVDQKENHYAIVSDRVPSLLNVRQSPSSSSTVLSQLTKNTKVVVVNIRRSGNTYWYGIQTKFMGSVVVGYVMAEYLDVKFAMASNAVMEALEGGRYNTTCSSVILYPGTVTEQLNMRIKAGRGFVTAGSVKKGHEVKILGWVTNTEGTWYKCNAVIDGKETIGYIPVKYVKQKSNPTGVVKSSVSGSLNVRKTYSASAAVRATIGKNKEVTIVNIRKTTDTYWYGIETQINGKKILGYVTAHNIDVTEKSETTTQGFVNNNVTTSVNVRKGPSTDTEILLSIPRNTIVTILGQSSNWYKVRVTYGEKTVTGYIMMTYITVSVTPGESEEEPEEEEEVEEKPTDDVAFETLIAKFPADYRTKLRALHEKHPNWKFVAVQTGLNWSDVIQNESIVGRNTIQSNYPKGGNTLAPFSYLSTESGAYNWANDTYIVKDGTNFYSASSQVISYYMDPRNFLNEDDIFQFEALAYDSSQKVSVVQSILSNTFMKGNYRVVDSATGKIATGSYKQAFMDAGKQSKSSPYFLASRVKQEVGVNGSNSTSGTYGAYAGIYNFYNIGAFDGGDAVAKGLQWAKGGASGATTYGRPWTTPYKSIVGGAQYIAKNYINKGQNTLYFQKFNVNPVNNSNLYLHQYMTAVQAPSLEGRSTKNAYDSLGILDDVMVFYIPVYNNMPAKACALPPATGNPNPYIRYTNLYNGTTKLTGLTPTFRYDRHEYTMVVPANVSSITFTAYAVSSRASITGAGTYTLKSAGQTTTIKLMGIAENGTRQVYTFKITRSAQ